MTPRLVKGASLTKITLGVAYAAVFNTLSIYMGHKADSSENSLSWFFSAVPDECCKFTSEWTTIDYSILPNYF